MSRNKALLAGFIIGAVVLGAVAFLLAPHLLALAGVGVGHAITQTVAANNFLISIPGWSAGVTAAAFGQLQVGIAVLAGAIGGLAGGLIGVSASKAENNPTSQHTPLSPATQINNTKTNGYSPELGVDEKNTGKSFVENYKQEKLENLQVPTQWRM